MIIYLFRPPSRLTKIVVEQKCVFKFSLQCFLKSFSFFLENFLSDIRVAACEEKLFESKYQQTLSMRLGFIMCYLLACLKFEDSVKPIRNIGASSIPTRTCLWERLKQGTLQIAPASERYLSRIHERVTHFMWERMLVPQVEIRYACRVCDEYLRELRQPLARLLVILHVILEGRFLK